MTQEQKEFFANNPDINTIYVSATGVIHKSNMGLSPESLKGFKVTTIHRSELVDSTNPIPQDQLNALTALCRYGYNQAIIDLDVWLHETGHEISPALALKMAEMMDEGKKRVLDGVLLKKEMEEVESEQSKELDNISDTRERIDWLISHGMIHPNGEPRKCPKCLSIDLRETVTDQSEMGTLEKKCNCISCGNEVGYWAYGNWQV